MQANEGLKVNFFQKFPSGKLKCVRKFLKNIIKREI